MSLSINEHPVQMGVDWFESFIQHAPALAFIKDIDGHYVFVNEAYRTCLKVEPKALLGKTDHEIWPEEIARELRENDRKILETGRPQQLQEKVCRAGATEPQFHLVTKFPLFKDGSVVALGGFAVDVTGQAVAEKALAESEQLYRVIAENTYDCETWVAPDGTIRYTSPSCEGVTGFSLQQFKQDPNLMRRIIHPEDLDRYDEHLRRLELGAEASHIEFKIIRPDGREGWLSQFTQRVYDEDENYLGLRTSSRDITDRKYIELQLKHRAFHDPLTELANRTLCLDRISQALERSKRRENYHYAVIFLDLDRFKLINDSLGHGVGDQLLIATSRRLQDCVRSLDTVARIGGDEFVVILEEIGSPSEAVRVIKRLRQEMTKPFYLSGHEVHVTVSQGVVFSPASYDNPEEMLRNANIAMRRAKQSGRNRFKVFTKALLEQVVQLLNLETALRQGLENDEFFTQYQPIISLKDQSLIGFEALVRWKHPVRGIISPGEFIPVAEDSGLIIPLGKFILHEACQTMAQWREREPRFQDKTVSVNISGKQLAQADLVDQVWDALQVSGLPPRCLKLEITESVLMENAESAVCTLRRLKELGVQISIDDFGTGYSSLSYLQRFPVDTLKVDQSFINEMEDKQENQEIVRAVIALAHSLGLDVIAEGVEKEPQLHILSELNCEHCQGFFFSRPLDPGQIVQKYLPVPKKKS